MHIFTLSLACLITAAASLAVQAPSDVALRIDRPHAHSIARRKNYDGWVNPEDLRPMPQCIWFQDSTAWMSIMTKCTSQRCTNSFCSHQQWLTELSCLAANAATGLLPPYIANCTISVLAGAQLYYWFYDNLELTYLITPGDADIYQSLTPASLPTGYTISEKWNYAPDCMAPSDTWLLYEELCYFSPNAKFYGNTIRAWEWQTSINGMAALAWEQVGYNSYVKPQMPHANTSDYYYDRTCFCALLASLHNNASTGAWEEPCAQANATELTRERLWINATCGPRLLPSGWASGLSVLNASNFAVDGFVWPRCVKVVPPQIRGLLETCEVEVCSVGGDGYCTEVVPAVQKECFCADISYQTWESSCAFFEERMEYIRWLQRTCGNVTGWAGLPQNWKDLTVPITDDLIPWRWRVVPTTTAVKANETVKRRDVEKAEKCPPNSWMIGSFAVVQAAVIILIPLLGRRTVVEKLSFGYLDPPYSLSCIFTGVLTAFLHIIASYIGARIVQKTPGYGHISAGRLTLLWCTMPRIGWLAVAFIKKRSAKAMYFSVAASQVFAESILQIISLYYMLLTVNYGREHRLYLGATKGAIRASPARMMYGGALFHVIIIWFVVLVLWGGVFSIGDLIVTTRSKAEEWIKLNDSRSKKIKSMRSKARQCSRETAERRLGVSTILHTRYQSEGSVIKDENWTAETQSWQDLLTSYERCAAGWDLFTARVRLVPHQESEHRNVRKERVGSKTLSGFRRIYRDKSRLVATSAPGSQPPQHIVDLRDELARFRTLLIDYKRDRGAEISGEDEYCKKESVSAEEEAKRCDVHVHDDNLLSQWSYMKKDWAALGSSWDSLQRYWVDELQKLDDATSDYLLSHAREHDDDLSTIIIMVLSAMAWVWIAQWLFWVGFVRLASEEFCPPKLGIIVACWIVFSALGIILGAAG